MSIVMIELDQSATGKTVDLPNRQPHLSKLDFDLFHKGRPGYSAVPRVSVEQVDPSWGQIAGDAQSHYQPAFASASLRPYSRDIRFPPFARTRASGSFR